MLSWGPVNISRVEYCGATGCTMAKVVVAWQSVVGGSATPAKLRIPPRLGVSASAAAQEHGMKITAIRTHYVRIPFDMGAAQQEFAGLRFPSMDHLLIEVETDAGISGWGEGFGHSIIPATKAALESYVGPWFIGKAATDIAALHREAAQ